MIKRLAALLLALMLSSAALAEVYEGRTAALTTVALRSPCAGTAEALDVKPGQRLRTGQRVARLRGRRTFAQEDGTVTSINAREGERVSGTQLELMPQSPYVIYCTVDKAYQSAGTTLVHSGELLYIRCTKDGSHRAVGVVTAIDGEEYRVITLGGALYVGETVYLYRDEGFSARQRVGIGTVVTADPRGYEADGVVTRLCVQEGDFVERGQLLFEVDGGDIEAPEGGILLALTLQPGDSVAEDQIVAELVPEGEIGVEIQVDEETASRLRPGDAARLTFADDEETEVAGAVHSVSWMAESGAYTVRIRPEAGAGLALGMSVTVRL